MAELRCSSCGVRAPATAVEGGTHYRELAHGTSRANPRGSGGRKLRTCGTWVKPGP